MDSLGAWVAGPGDVNGDGYPDILVGTQRVTGQWQGDPNIPDRAYLLYDPCAARCSSGPYRTRSSMPSCGARARCPGWGICTMGCPGAVYLVGSPLQVEQEAAAVDP